MSNLKYFYGSIALTLLGLALAAAIGWYEVGTAAAVANSLFIVTVLGVLEISLSFDNAVVNAAVLAEMTPVWQRRFLTWGIAIAVFGMRLVLPLVVVCLIAWMGPIDALYLAFAEPAEYGRILKGAEHLISAFGGSFLAMVCLDYFFDAEKEVHWIAVVEEKLCALGRIEALELAIAMVLLYTVSKFLPHEEAAGFLAAGIMGLVTFILVDGLGALLKIDKGTMHDASRASAGMFLYLEVLDASFSFDGVIGAFAMTDNLFLIAIGLGVGAMFVRSITVMLVDKGTLDTYRFLEHGAFYAIGALALIMFLKVLHEVPEAVTGLIGAVFIALSIISSVRYRNKEVASKCCTRREPRSKCDV